MSVDCTNFKVEVQSSDRLNFVIRGLRSIILRHVRARCPRKNAKYESVITRRTCIGEYMQLSEYTPHWGVGNFLLGNGVLVQIQILI
jgi:hypothetical protein